MHMKVSANKKDKTGLVRHYIETGHEPDTDKLRILTTEPNYCKRLTLESLNILKCNTYNL